MNMFGKKWCKSISDLLHIPTALVLIGIAIFFVALIFQLFGEAVWLFYTEGFDFYGALERIFLIFLCIEVVASVKLYFKHNYHFPLRFFFYIGITDLIRHIIVSYENAHEVLYYTFGILVLVVVLTLWEYKTIVLDKTIKSCKSCEDPRDFEL